MKNIQPILAGSILFIAACVCSSSSSNPPQVIGNATTAPTAQTARTYAIGEIIQTGDSTITLNSASIQGNTLHANFTVENKGSTEMTVSSLLSFTAKNSDGSKLEQNIFDCESGGLDGSIVAGDLLRGNICWDGATSNTVKIYYEPDLFSSTTVIWEVNR